MLSYASFRQPLVASSLWIALIASSSAALAQDALPFDPGADRERNASESSADQVAYTFEGFVVEPDWTSAEGAIVVTSAGGQAVTDVNGSFRITVEVPVEAETVQLTAVGLNGKNLVASLPVQVDARFELVHLGTLVLAHASTCSPSWLPTFGPAPGLDSTIFALTVFDDGSGSALYAGGNFTEVGSGIAKWDGTFWKPLGTGTDASVYALIVFDDGTGDALYAGGSFITAGGVNALRIAKWNGTGVGPS